MNNNVPVVLMGLTKLTMGNRLTLPPTRLVPRTVTAAASMLAKTATTATTAKTTAAMKKHPVIHKQL